MAHASQARLHAMIDANMELRLDCARAERESRVYRRMWLEVCSDRDVKKLWLSANNVPPDAATPVPSRCRRDIGQMNVEVLERAIETYMYR